MAEIETSVVIRAKTDDLQSGMETAANAVRAATAARCRLSSRTWGWPRSRRNCRSATLPTQVGSSIDELQQKLQTSQGRSVMAS